MAISWKRLGAYLGIFGGIQFIIITAIIMAIYPDAYNFFLNSFSQLGQAVTNSVPTPQNWFLFAFTSTLVAACSIPFWLAMRTIFTSSKRLQYIGWLGTILKNTTKRSYRAAFRRFDEYTGVSAQQLVDEVETILNTRGTT